MTNCALDIALGQGGPASRALIERLQDLFALEAAFLVAIEHDDIAMHDGFEAELVFDEGEIDVKLPKHIGKLAVVVEGDFNPVEGL